MKASDLFIKALENEGIKYIFAVPGEENLDLLESIRNSSIELIITRHEQTAGFMAATYGRLTGEVGACLATLGPGATNLVTAAAYAELGAMPMLMITGQKPIKHSKQGKFQIVDIVEMMRPLTKSTKQIVNGNTIPALVHESCRLAKQERPGATHLELPEDIAEEDTTAEIFEVHQSDLPTAEEHTIQQAAAMIHAAKMPLVLIGAAANRKKTCIALQDFVDHTQIPFFNTQMGKGVIDERHPLYLGTAALSDGDYVHCAINRADLIINIGHDIVEKPPFFMHKGGTKVIHVNFFPSHTDPVYFPNLDVVGDITSSINSLTRALKPQTNWDFAYYHRIKHAVEKQISNGDGDDRFPVLPQRLVRAVREAVPEDGIIALDNGMYKIWFARNYKAYGPNTVLLDNALATMGAGLPSAMAAKMVYPDKAVLAICGDGGFMMNLQDLETAVRLKLNLIILLLRDDGYGMIKWKQALMGLANYGLDFTNPDFVKLAESFGARGYRIKNTAEITNVIKDSLSHEGVTLIDIPIDYSQNAAELGEKLKQKTCLI